MLNYKHLYYFYTVAKEGSITRASERLKLTPQTISGQLSLLEDYFSVELFNKVGRNIELTEVGRQIVNYADEIFALGNNLEQIMHQLPKDQPQLFRVGVVDAIPKSISQKILLPVLHMAQATRMVCHEADLERLLAQLTLHRLDLVIADRPIPASVSIRGFSHKLGQSAVSFFASQDLASQLQGDFPQCLNDAPILLPSIDNQLRFAIEQWLKTHQLYPRIVAEFDDSALMKAFGQQGAGVFIAPTAIKDEIMLQYNLVCIGQTAEINEEFYAISLNKRLINPIIATVIKSAHQLFSKGINNE